MDYIPAAQIVDLRIRPRSGARAERPDGCIVLGAASIVSRRGGRCEVFG